MWNRKTGSVCFGPSLARPPLLWPLGHKALIYFLKKNNPCSKARCSEMESGNCWLGLLSAAMRPGTDPGREPGSLRRPRSLFWEQTVVTPRSTSRNVAAGGGCNARRRAVRHPATLGLLLETRSQVTGTKAWNKGKIVFPSAIYSGTLCGPPRASLPRLTAAGLFERCCSLVANDIRSCQASGVALGL